MKTILLALLLLVSSSQATDQKTMSGKVISVADGDTMTILTGNNRKIKIRLQGIDAPEKSQAFGAKAKDYLNKLCYGKKVTVKKDKKDMYGRLLGIVYVDGENVNEEMVRRGLAWHYKHFSNDTRLEYLERLARKAKLNIWSQKNPVPPYEYRKNKKKKSK